MSAADSPVTRLRARLARLIEPRPSPGDAWCVDCSLHEGRTWAMPVRTAEFHVKTHQVREGHGFVALKMAYRRGDLT